MDSRDRVTLAAAFVVLSCGGGEFSGDVSGDETGDADVDVEPVRLGDAGDAVASSDAQATESAAESSRVDVSASADAAAHLAFCMNSSYVGSGVDNCPAYGRSAQMLFGPAGCEDFILSPAFLEAAAVNDYWSGATRGPCCQKQVPDPATRMCLEIDK